MNTENWSQLYKNDPTYKIMIVESLLLTDSSYVFYTKQKRSKPHGDLDLFWQLV